MSDLVSPEAARAGVEVQMHNLLCVFKPRNAAEETYTSTLLGVRFATEYKSALLWLVKVPSAATPLAPGLLQQSYAPDAKAQGICSWNQRWSVCDYRRPLLAILSTMPSHVISPVSLIASLGREPTVWAECLFVDPIADIAVLGSPDDEELSEQAERWKNLIDDAEALVIARLLESAPVWLLSLDGRWRQAHA
jgi:hypothetical protein